MLNGMVGATSGTGKEDSLLSCSCVHSSKCSMLLVTRFYGPCVIVCHRRNSRTKRLASALSTRPSQPPLPLPPTPPPPSTWAPVMFRWSLSAMHSSGAAVSLTKSSRRRVFFRLATSAPTCYIPRYSQFVMLYMISTAKKYFKTCSEGRMMSGIG